MSSPTARLTARPLVLIGAVAIVVALGVAAILAPRGTASDGYSQPDEPLELRFDIAEDGTRFAFDESPVFDDDGMPDRGNEFVTHGVIYADGTLSDTDGILVDDDGIATPEFPDAVIGEWICYGTFINDGAHETDDAWVVTTQIYTFNDGSSFTSVGTERPPGTGPSVRAITGGTGDYAGAGGEVAQLINGFNDAEGVNGDFIATITEAA